MAVPVIIFVVCFGTSLAQTVAEAIKDQRSWHAALMKLRAAGQ